MPYTSNHKSNKKKYVLLAIGIFVALAIASGTNWLKSVNRGVITEAPNSEVKHGPSFQTYESQYMKFQYNSTYRVQKIKNASDQELEVAVLTADTSFQKHLAVRVLKLTNGSLDSNGSYYSRLAQKNLYKSEDVLVDNKQAVIFTKNDRSEISVFIKQGVISTSLSFTTDSIYDELRSEVDALLLSYQGRS